MEVRQDNLVATQDVIDELDTSRATLYVHLKRINIETVKVKGRSFIQKEHLKVLRESLAGKQDKARKREIPDGVRRSRNLERLEKAMQDEQEKRISDQEGQITFQREQIKELNNRLSELQESLTNQQKLQLMDKGLMQGMKEQMQQLEFKNSELEQTQTKEARTFKVIQLSIYLGLLLTLGAVNYYLFPVVRIK